MYYSQQLENAVLAGTPQEVASFYRMYREGANAGRALAIACRFRGLEYVKALVENGAAFGSSEWEWKYWLAPLEIYEKLLRTDIIRDSCFCADDSSYTFPAGTAAKTFKPLTVDQRAEIVKYLCANSKRVCFDPDEMLFYSIMSNSQKITAVLREAGAAFSEDRIRSITESTDYRTERSRKNMRRGLLILLGLLDYDIAFDVIRNIVKEIGGKRIYCDELTRVGKNDPDSLYITLGNRFFEPEFLGFFLENFKIPKNEKAELVKEAIYKNNVEGLAVCAEQGWLNEPHKRDEMIALAFEHQRTECLAWLLDFKNRNFNLAAERDKAEKKARHELNVAPDSPTALANIWSWKKLVDGTLVITEYKGTYKEIIVPSKIGNRTVTAIGQIVFSIIASGDIPGNMNNPRYNMSRIVLPDGIRSIGERAFARCRSLDTIVIPDSVVKIGDGAFSCCDKLTEIVIPSSVTEIGAIFFYSCDSLRSVKLPAGIKRIGYAAFESCGSLEELALLDGVAEIGEKAFSQCTALKTVVIPASVKLMGDNVFSRSENVTVIVEHGSYAEEYCKQNNIPFGYGNDV